MGVKAFLMHGDVLAVGTVTNLMPPRVPGFWLGCLTVSQLLCDGMSNEFIGIRLIIIIISVYLTGT